MQGKNARTEITAADLELQDTNRSSPTVPLNGDLNQVERQMIIKAVENSGGNQSKAAQALGISRRTLLRKLKIYRETGAEARAGALSVSQQRYYRAEINRPVTLKCGDERFDCTLLNLSLGGAAIATHMALKFGTPVSLCLSIPEADIDTELFGRVAWSNRDGEHGVQFTELSSSIRSILERWLLAEMKTEGWETEELR
jgi:hypothetical protein